MPTAAAPAAEPGGRRGRAPCFLDVASRIGARLAASARWEGDACSWRVPVRVGDGGEGPRPVRMRPAGPSVYSGSAGIALFLAELYRRTGRPELLHAAEGGVRASLASLSAFPSDALGFHAGPVGVAYAAAEVAAAGGSTALEDAARGIVAALGGRAHADRGIDVVGVAAGAVPVLLRMGSRPGLEASRTLALALGERLLRAANREAAGWSWGIPRPSLVRFLCGLGHGTSGVAHALVELYRATGDGAFRYAAEQGFLYERQFFDPDRGNWPDLRDAALSEHVFRSGGPERLRERLARGERLPPWTPSYMCAWCHGAAGMALVRLHAWRVLGDSLLLDEARAAVRATRRSLEGDGVERWCLCHGVAGNAEVLLEAAAVLREPGLAAFARERALSGARRYELRRRRWPDGSLSGRRDPGLMLGEAGVGWFFLRLASPEVPSLLLPRSEESTAPPREGRAPGLRAGYVEGFFGSTTRRFAALRRLDAAVPAVVLPPADPHVSEPRAARRAVRAALDAVSDPALRARLEDAAALDEAALELLDGDTDHAAEFVAGLRRTIMAERLGPDSTLALAPGVRLVWTEHDWDAWLARPEGPPPPAPTPWALWRERGSVRRERLSPFAALLLEALRRPGSCDEAAARLTGRARVPPHLPARVQAQAREAVLAGLLTLEAG